MSTKTKKAEAPAKAKTRTELLAALAERKYTGPLSFTATTLRDVLTWLDAGANAGDESIPNGVRFAVHPDLRPAKATTNRVGKVEAAYARGRASVLSEVASLTNLKAIREYLAANETEDAK